MPHESNLTILDQRELLADAHANCIEQLAQLGVIQKAMQIAEITEPHPQSKIGILGLDMRDAGGKVASRQSAIKFHVAYDLPSGNIGYNTTTVVIGETCEDLVVPRYDFAEPEAILLNDMFETLDLASKQGILPDLSSDRSRITIPSGEFFDVSW
jgi:hypothetical protein